MTLTLPALVDCPLSRMVQRTPTDYWNDSCAADDLAYAIERGAVGATSNPTIVLEVMQKEKTHWTGRVRSPRRRAPGLDRARADVGDRRGDGRPWRGAAASRSSSGKSGRVGRLSIQTNPSLYPDERPDARAGPPLRHARAEHPGQVPGHPCRHRGHRGGDVPRREHQRHRLASRFRRRSRSRRRSSAGCSDARRAASRWTRCARCAR